MLKLRFKNNKPNAVWLVEPKVTIGRASGNDLVIEDPAVAAQHAEILVAHETLTLVNTSGQPLLVNDQPVDKSIPVPLTINDQLQVGETRLEVIDPKQDQAGSPRAAASGESTGWALKAQHAALANRVFAVKAETVIGRSNDCDITLAAAHLSRRHAKLVVEDGLLYVRDLGSANGTFLNGKRVTEARVRQGDELRLDTLRFRVTGPAAADLDKTSVRPMAAVAPSPAADKPRAPVQTRVQRPTRSAPRGEPVAANVVAVAARNNRAESKSTVGWLVALLVVAALAAGIAWQQGLIGG